MTRFVSLLRGINVGGHQSVRMDALNELHASLGLQEVQTYIQSGNVVFSSDDADGAEIQKHIEDGFAQKFGFQVKVMIRTADEFNTMIENNPFQNQPMNDGRLDVFDCRKHLAQQLNRPLIGERTQITAV